MAKHIHPQKGTGGVILQRSEGGGGGK